MQNIAGVIFRCLLIIPSKVKHTHQYVFFRKNGKGTLIGWLRLLIRTKGLNMKIHVFIARMIRQFFPR
ncbi:hypothetical protein T230_11780 [Tannerella sp. oral taxon BU063 isolate Cell 1/3]|uniref:Uncharacterized protein n=2 Tax=Tannerella serpentiformis TaxID=712710 RepID=W2CHP8_9BACT|nr:hypothetical protein T230_11780 [Tannerella sp. oral taxon BU063 isolate Cell 1/3]ETK13190.1 hypothetical protein T235_04490 [Tannerella sp. oral taxon BU063 isolate Cell 8/11]